jgi:hypothetical protein
MPRKSAEQKLVEVIDEIGFERIWSLLRALALSKGLKNAFRRKGPSQSLDLVGKMQLAPQSAPGQPPEMGDPVPVKPIVFGGPSE